MEENQFSRTEMLIGKEGLQKLHHAKVAIFGIGGVGSFVAEGLIRAGIGEFVLIDKDTISITNLNRQIHADHTTIGKDKVEVMKNRMLAINPNVKVKAMKEFYLPDNAEKLIDTSYSYIVDAVDNVTAKVSLAIMARKIFYSYYFLHGYWKQIKSNHVRSSRYLSNTNVPVGQSNEKRTKE